VKLLSKEDIKTFVYFYNFLLEVHNDECSVLCRVKGIHLILTDFLSLCESAENFNECEKFRLLQEIRVV
jgi:hypothetical protein